MKLTTSWKQQEEIWMHVLWQKVKTGGGQSCLVTGPCIGQGFPEEQSLHVSQQDVYQNGSLRRAGSLHRHSIDTVPKKRAQGWSSVEDDTLISCHSRKWVALAVPIWYLKPERFQESCGSSAHLGSWKSWCLMPPGVGSCSSSISRRERQQAGHTAAAMEVIMSRLPAAMLPAREESSRLRHPGIAQRHFSVNSGSR